MLLPRPSYPLFDYLASLESVEADSYSLVYDGSWSIDLETIRSKLGPRTRALLLVHPNNPTGSYVKRGELTELTAMCREHDVALVVDEVFADYGFGEDMDRVSTFVGRNDVLTFVLSGLSKIAALPQMKLAWIWTGGPDDQKRDALTRLEQVGDVFLSVGAQVQHAAAKLLDLAPSLQTAIRQRLVENSQFLTSVIPTSSPLEALPTEGGWYSVLRCPEVQSFGGVGARVSRFRRYSCPSRIFVRLPYRRPYRGEPSDPDQDLRTRYSADAEPRRGYRGSNLTLIEQ